MKTTFNIKNTVLLTGLILSSQSLFADQVIPDDLIVVGNTCIGTDCFNGETFNLDTIKLKENNLRLYFQDTSSSSSFPSNDWRIEINDSSNGGANYFAISDVDGSQTPFKIEAGAATNTVVLDSSGKLGIGTNAPTVTLHVVGDAFISGNLELGSSRSLKSNIRPLETDEAVAALKALQPMKYHYKSHPEEDTLGFIAEDVPDLVATNSRKSLMPADIIAVLTKVIQKQEITITSLSQRLDALEQK